jgi:hypothetical protein
VVIEGGGFVRVGDERARVAAGEAVMWPPDVIHSAWTELTPMRAIVVEFALGRDADAADAADSAGPLLIAGSVLAAEAIPAAGEVRVDGGPAARPMGTPDSASPDRVSPEQEPW